MAIALFFVSYLLVALACLRQWGAPDPWWGLDFFSGGFFAASPLWLVENAIFLRGISRTKEIRDEAGGATYDRSLLVWTGLLPLAELIVFYEYGHWRLAPALRTPYLQGLGLALWVATPAWLLWADRYLGRHFATAEAQRQVLTGGPFAHVRHPRYLGLLASRVAFALVFASPIAWLLVGAWIAAVARRIRREERHLGEIYGTSYEAYAAATPRLLPWFRR